MFAFWLSGNWQDLIAVGLVVLAAAYLVRLAWNTFFRRNKSTGCGTCSTCPTNATSAGRQQVVTIKPLDKTAATR